MKRILISNDDGFHAPGLRALAEALTPLAEVTVVAPVEEQSASSHALTLQRPLRVKQIAPRRFAVDGTPTDSVLLAVNELLDRPPDLVVSGINQGPNLGEDVLYSGTVAAAMEGAVLGIPSAAVSLASYEYTDFAASAALTATLVARILEARCPGRFLVNMNVPPLPGDAIRGFRVTRLGTRVYKDVIVKKRDPRGRDYYWIGGGAPSWTPTPESDIVAVTEGYVALTPLLMDITDSSQLEFLESLGLR